MQNHTNQDKIAKVQCNDATKQNEQPKQNVEQPKKHDKEQIKQAPESMKEENEPKKTENEPTKQEKDPKKEESDTRKQPHNEIQLANNRKIAVTGVDKPNRRSITMSHDSMMSDTIPQPIVRKLTSGTPIIKSLANQDSLDNSEISVSRWRYWY